MLENKKLQPTATNGRSMGSNTKRQSDCSFDRRNNKLKTGDVIATAKIMSLSTPMRTERKLFAAPSRLASATPFAFA